MTDVKPRLLVADQSLRGFEGHHFDYGRSVIAAARHCGVIPLLACHTEFPHPELEGAPVVGRFATSWDGARRSSIQQWGLKILSRFPEHLRNALLDRLPASQKKATAPKADPQFAKELLRISVEAKLGKADHVFVHTLGEAQFLGLSSVLSNEQLCPSPTWHLMLRYDGSEAYREAFVRLARCQAPIRYWTDTPHLADQYLSLGCPSISVLPIPHGLDIIPERVRPAHAPLTLSFLGGARADKGFHLLPELVASLAEDYLATGKIRFLIQTTYGLSREAPLMWKTKQALKAFPQDWVELIESPPDQAEFNAALQATDLLLLPYDRQTYARRSSGLLIQALAAGIPTIVTDGTWLADVAPQGAHFAFEADLNTAVKNAILDHVNLMDEARKLRFDKQIEHHPDCLVRLLLN